MKLKNNLLLLFLVSSLHAQLTTISQLVLNGDGQPFTGEVVIQVPPFSSRSAAVRSRDIWICSPNNVITDCPAQIVAGVLTVRLLPNGGGSPSGTSYYVTYYPDVPPGRRPSTKSEYWVVPSGGPFTIDQVKVATAPIPSISISPTQLNAAGYTVGQFPCVVGGTFLPCGPTVVPTFGPNILVTGTDANGNIIASPLQGTGPSVQMSAGGTTTFGNCVSYDFNGNTQDSGTNCSQFAPSNSNLVRSTSNGKFATASLHNVSATMFCGTAGGSSGAAYRCLSSPGLAPVVNDFVIFFATIANTGPCTLAVNVGVGLGQPIRKKGGTVNLVANDIIANMFVLLVFDGAVWQMLSPTAN